MKITEHKIQCAIVRILRLMDYLVFAIPNGGKRNEREAIRLRDEGVLAGVADLCCIGKDGQIFWIEVKSATGRQSDAQRVFAENIEQRGGVYAVVKSVNEAVELVRGGER